MKKQVKKFEILSLRRGNNSYYGNPSWYLGLADNKGDIYYAKTASNASIGYSVDSSWVGKVKKLEYHFTTTGNMIVDCLVK